MSDLLKDMERIHETLSEKDQARETSIKKVRMLIRMCGEGIRSLHRGDNDRAERAREDTKAIMTEICDELKNHPDLLNSGSVRAGLAEYVELAAVLELLTKKSLPSIDSVGVPPAAYLNGIGDAIGEIRRHILDLLRRGETTEAEEYLEICDNIYDSLMTFDYPKAIVGDLRRKQDVARSLLEKTRADVTSAVLHKSLSDKLDGSQG